MTKAKPAAKAKPKAKPKESPKPAKKSAVKKKTEPKKVSKVESKTKVKTDLKKNGDDKKKAETDAKKKPKDEKGSKKPEGEKKKLKEEPNKQAAADMKGNDQAKKAEEQKKEAEKDTADQEKPKNAQAKVTADNAKSADTPAQQAQGPDISDSRNSNQEAENSENPQNLAQVQPSDPTVLDGSEHPPPCTLPQPLPQPVVPAQFPVKVLPTPIAVSDTSRNSDDSSEKCVVCRDADCLRINLRNCDHIICVACFLGFLQNQIQLKAKVGIRCPQGNCSKEVHENDINAVLDIEEAQEGLNVYMTREGRQWLQYQHYKDCIIIALAGPDPNMQDRLIKRCPKCTAIYLKRDGCNNVICANLRCSQNFCWQCGKPIRGIGHFTGKDCKVSYDDVHYSMVIFGMLIDINRCGALFGIPVFFLFFHVGSEFVFPVLMLILFPTVSVQWVYKKATKETKFLTPAEKLLLCLKAIAILILTIPVGAILGAASIVSGFIFFLIYLGFAAMKMNGVADKVAEKYDTLLPFAERLGLGPWKRMLREAREEREQNSRLQYELEQNVIEREKIEEEGVAPTKGTAALQHVV